MKKYAIAVSLVTAMLGAWIPSAHACDLIGIAPDVCKAGCTFIFGKDTSAEKMCQLGSTQHPKSGNGAKATP
ncbi:MAG: hypothetical protein JWP38_2244 [Herbaspirillum sp.]|jgi:hypothetical protein|nr:hypothetical protein [Herbaspirillum sp.]